VGKGIGCRAVSLFEDGAVAHKYHFDWPKEFLKEVDEESVRFRNNTLCLEIIGMLLVMVSNSLFYKNSNVIIKIDCLGAIFRDLEQRF
jgi:hypothetical protein